MAVYTPAQIMAVASISSTTIATASVTTAASTTGIARTIQVQSPTTARVFNASLGADAAGTRFFAGQALTASVASIYNGWWVTAANSASAMQFTQDTTSSNSVIGTVGGYFFS